MDSFREYVLAVVASAMICAVISNLFQNSSLKELVRLLGGLMLTLTVIKPITDIDFSALSQWELPYMQDAAYYRKQGEVQADEAISERIKAETEAYILAEAERMKAKIQVEIMLNEDCIPYKADLRGNISPVVRQHMQTFLETTFAIAKENQIWTG